MKLLFVLSCLIAYCVAADHCYNDIVSACKPAGAGTAEIINCNAKYGNIHSFANDLQKFANKNIAHSFEYLLLSTHFHNYEKNREGFGKLYRKLSDKAWNDGIELIKYMTKRGLTMDFQAKSDDLKTEKDETYELYELESLSKSLDIQKSLATEAHNIHKRAHEDAEVMSHIENNFVHALRDTVRELAGHTSDLKNLVTNNHKPALDVYLFDEYLQKLY